MQKLQDWCKNTAKYIKENIVKPICAFFVIIYTIIVGSDKITPSYSVAGVLDRKTFLAVIICFSVIRDVIGKFHFPILAYVCGLLLFYCLVAAIQKRCRDFHYSGTFFILVATLAMIISYGLYFVNLSELDKVSIMCRRFVQVKACLYLLLLVLFFIPSKPEADLNLRSPLLKYPLVYTAICWALAIAATIGVNYLTATGI